MKTCEQLAADVLARRDAYLARRRQRRRRVIQYAAASLAALAVVIAASGLYRSGLFRADPPVSVSGPDRYTTEAASSAGPSAGAPTGRAERGTDGPGTGAGKAPAGNAEPTGALAPTERETPAAVPEEEAGTAAGEEGPTGKTPADATTARQTAPTAPAFTRNEPTRKDLPAGSTEPTTGNDGYPQAHAPTTDAPGTSEKPSATPSTHAAQEPSATPSSHAAEEPSLASPQELNNNAIYVAYHGALYMAEDAPAVAVPAGAETLAEKDAYLYGGALLLDADMQRLLPPGPTALSGALAGRPSANSGQPADQPELLDTTAQAEETPPVRTAITLVSLPDAAAGGRIGVKVEGVGGMFVLEYYAPLEDLTQEEIP